METNLLSLLPYRFLRANKLSIDRTVGMWERHLKWREERNIDEAHHVSVISVTAKAVLGTSEDTNHMVD